MVGVVLWEVVGGGGYRWHSHTGSSPRPQTHMPHMRTGTRTMPRTQMSYMFVHYIPEVIANGTYVPRVQPKPFPGTERPSYGPGPGDLRPSDLVVTSGSQEWGPGLRIPSWR